MMRLAAISVGALIAGFIVGGLVGTILYLLNA